MFDVLITNGRIIDGTGTPGYRADLAISGDCIVAIGIFPDAEAKSKIDASGKVICPGFIDAHVHGDLVLLADPYHEPAIRQGVTTYIIGQDGVNMAPASAPTLQYMRQYTAGFSGVFSLDQQWQSVKEYLACFDRRCALNVVHLVPNGNLRMEVFGLETREPAGDELLEMSRLLREGMEQGAVGLSTGMDYIPSLYATTEELIALCKVMAPYGGVYVTHQRRYDPEGVRESMEEVFRIGREAKVPVHISHFNSRSDIVLPLVDQARNEGLEVTYDLYCYLAGSTILAMAALPPWVQEGGPQKTMERLKDPAVRSRLEEGHRKPRGPVENLFLSFIAADSHKQFAGKTIGQAAEEANQGVADFICDVLIASKMEVGCIAPHLQRTEQDIEQLMRHPAMMGGSDGIFTGNFPHPRGYGCFARYLGYYVREKKTWTLEEAVQHLAAHPANRFGLRDRGILRPGLVADVVILDPGTITDHATYENGRQPATGIDSVLVNGELVLDRGRRTKSLPGRALKA